MTMSSVEMSEAYEVGQAMVAMGEAIASRPDGRLLRLCAGHEVSEHRAVSLQMAIELGADEATLVVLRDATRVSRSETIVLPRGRYEHCSRGKGWARMGRGNAAVWGDRVDGGHRVGPGRWELGSTDGFSRKSRETWDVSHVRVGEETWTVAS